MKRKIGLRSIIIVFAILASLHFQHVKAQSIKIVPDPNGEAPFFGVGISEIYNNNLYSLYYKYPDQLPQLGYFDGNTTTLIPNPSANGEIINILGIINNKLCLAYFDTSQLPLRVELATYNGSTLNIVAPSTYYSASTVPGTVYNNNMFFTNFISTLSSPYNTARFDGTNFTSIPNPANDGFAGTGIAFGLGNNNLYLDYISHAGIVQLAVYNGNGYTPIDNPAGGAVSYVTQFNGKVYIQCGINGTILLGVLNGSAYTLIPNPPAPGTLYGLVKAYNNKLYFNYKNENGIQQLAQYDGVSFSLIPNPDNSTDSTLLPGLTSIIYNNKLHFQYRNASGIYQLAQYDGNRINLIQNPDNGAGYYNPFYTFNNSPIIYNNKLYFQYLNESGIYQLAKFDGSEITLIGNPDNNLTDSLLGYQGYPVIFKNKLYFSYTNESGISHLAYLDETEIIPDSHVVPAKPDSQYASYEYTDTAGWTNYYYDNNTPNDFTDDTLLLSLKKNGQNIGTIGDGTFTVKLVATANAGSNTGIDVTSPLITNTSHFWAMNRYWQVTTTAEPSTSVGVRFYYNNQDLKDVSGSYPSHDVANSQLIFYKADGGNPDPTSHLEGVTKLISILPAAHASDTTWTYHVFNDTAQYAEFTVSGFSGGGGGATGNNLTLPLTFLNFSAQLKNKNALLTWQTATEENSDYFNIQRSTDGLYFNTIGKVSAAGNSLGIKNYTYNDVGATLINTGTLYYRLQEVDKDNRNSYSTIQLINLINKVIITVTPNPVKDFINITSSADIRNAKISVIDMSGRKYYSSIQNLTAGDRFRISVNNLPKGVYTVLIKDDSAQQQVKIIK